MISHPENSFSSGFAPFHYLSRQIDRPEYIAPYYRLRLASLGVLPYADPPASTIVIALPAEVGILDTRGKQKYTKKPDLNIISWLVSAQPARGIMPNGYTQGDKLVTD